MSFTVPIIIMFVGIPAVVILIALFRKGYVRAALSPGRFCFKLEAADRLRDPSPVAKGRSESVTPSER